MSHTKRGGDLPHQNTSPRAPDGAKEDLNQQKYIFKVLLEM